MCKDYKVTFKTSIYQVPGNECICIKDTWELHMTFSLSVYQILDLLASLVALKALGVQSPMLSKKWDTWSPICHWLALWGVGMEYWHERLMGNLIFVIWSLC